MRIEFHKPTKKKNKNIVMSISTFIQFDNLTNSLGSTLGNPISFENTGENLSIFSIEESENVTYVIEYLEKSTNSTNENERKKRSLAEILIVSLALGCLILATIIGNIFVISAIILEKNLKSVGNYLVLSLAVTDLLVACLVMPIGALYEITQEWNLGSSLCELWTSADVLCCTARYYFPYYPIIYYFRINQSANRLLGLNIIIFLFSSY